MGCFNGAGRDSCAIILAVLETVLLGKRTAPVQKMLRDVGIVGVLLATVSRAVFSGANTVWGVLLLLGAQLSDCLFCIASPKNLTRVLGDGEPIPQLCRES